MSRRVFGRFLHSHDHKFLAMYSPVIAFSWWRSKKSKTPEDIIYETAALKQFHTAAHNSLPWGWTGHVFEPNFRFPQTYDKRNGPIQTRTRGLNSISKKNRKSICVLC